MRFVPDVAAQDRSLTQFLAENAHAFTRAELLRHWSRRSLENADRSGQAVRMLPGIYAGAAAANSPKVRAEAASLWAPRAYLTGQAALHLHEPRLPAPAHVDLMTVNGDALHPPPWIRVHQWGPPRAYASPQGVNCVPAPRALLDAWRLAEPTKRPDLLWEALWSRVCTWRQLAGELVRAPRVSGRRELERMLGWFDAGATSPLEVRAQRETFADVRFRDFEWQVPVELPGRKSTLDMLHRRSMVAVELDGDRYHSTRAARDGDRSRQTDLVAAGFAVLRFGWRDVVDRPEWCRARLLATVRTRVARAGSH